jgi:hypothetical protein
MDRRWVAAATAVVGLVVIAILPYQGWRASIALLVLIVGTLIALVAMRLEHVERPRLRFRGIPTRVVPFHFANTSTSLEEVGGGTKTAVATDERFTQVPCAYLSLCNVPLAHQGGRAAKDVWVQLEFVSDQQHDPEPLTVFARWPSGHVLSGECTVDSPEPRTIAPHVCVRIQVGLMFDHSLYPAVHLANVGTFEELRLGDTDCQVTITATAIMGDREVSRSQWRMTAFEGEGLTLRRLASDTPMSVQSLWSRLFPRDLDQNRNRASNGVGARANERPFDYEKD